MSALSYHMQEFETDYTIIPGVVRKQLGLAFLGETREDVRLLIGDLYVEGLDGDVSYH